MAGDYDLLGGALDTFAAAAAWDPTSKDWTKSKRYLRRSLDDFETGNALAYVSFDAASDAIRKQIKRYVESYATGVEGEFFAITSWAPNSQKLFVVTISREIEDAIAASKAILGLEANPTEGIAVAYTEATWERAVKLLRELADLFWQARGDFLPTPSIDPAAEGSIDLFWEFGDLTLLINIPSDPAQGATFFGRRLATSKIAGVIDRNDVEPRHITGWLAGAE
jgi:hypothetical protein